MISKASAGKILHKVLPAIFSLSLVSFSVCSAALAQSDLSSLARGLKAGDTQSDSFDDSSTPQQTLVQPQPLTREQIQEMNTPSEVEELFTNRAGQDLKLFGYTQFGRGQPVVLTQIGGVQDNYILGVGDQIVVTLRGQENSQNRIRVNRSGQVVLPKIAPVSAAGRTFGAFRADLEAAIKRAYVSTSAFVSIGQVRQINVMVSGQVHVPGMRSLNGMSTVVDALLLSGGVRKDGSLRNVEIQRDGRTLHVDLYSVLVGQGNAGSLSLRDGDRIVVPALGPTFAVTGDLHRKGIFELPSGLQKLSLRKALSLAGNALVPGVYRISLLHQSADGQMNLEDVTDQKNAVVHAGEVVQVKLVSDIALNQVSLRGAVLSPGVFSLHKYKTLHDMLPSADAFSHDAYMLFGYIDRINHISHQHIMVPFSPKHIIEGKQNIALQNDDRVVIFSRDSMQNTVREAMLRIQSRNAFISTGRQNPIGEELTLTQPLFPSAEQGKNLGYHGQVSGVTAKDASTAGVPGTANLGKPMLPGGDVPSGAVSVQTNAAVNAQLAATSQVNTNTDQSAVKTNVGNSKSVQETPLSLEDRMKKMAIYYRVAVDGAVEVPGVYLVAPGTTLAEAMMAAGGLRPDADRSNVEITSSILDAVSGSARTTRKNYSVAKAGLANKVQLQPRDNIVFREVYTNRASGTVTILGQVRYPGTYSILRGERLSSVLMRAGGLTSTAYPYGTVFLRKSVARLEQAGNAREAKQLENMLITAMTRVATDSQMKGDSFTVLQGYIQQLKSMPALGRISVLADPAKLAANPKHDPVMQSGDKVVIPERPYTVSVMGEVLQPTSVPYKEGRSAKAYVKLAGGFSQMADEGEIFVVLPNGSAFRANHGWLSFGSRDIPPGSSVYVGRDISGYDLRQGVIDVTKIFSTMATSLAAIAAIDNN